LDEAFHYLCNVKVASGKLAIKSPRKAAFLGFMTLIKSISAIFDKTCKGDDPPMK
jgi:hypothetical protein